MRRLHLVTRTPNLWRPPADATDDGHRKREGVLGGARGGIFLTECGAEVNVFTPRELLCCFPATAIFAANDSMAIGAIAALTEAGRAVPEDAAVAGFDDIPIGRYLTPSLSSVSVPASEIGSRTIACLVHATEHKNHHVRGHEVVATRLAIRNTCGPHDYPRRQGASASRSSLKAPTPIEAVP